MCFLYAVCWLVVVVSVGVLSVSAWNNAVFLYVFCKLSVCVLRVVCTLLVSCMRVLYVFLSALCLFPTRVGLLLCICSVWFLYVFRDLAVVAFCVLCFPVIVC